MSQNNSLKLLTCLIISGLLLVTGCKKEQENTAPAVPDLTHAITEIVKDAETKSPEIKPIVEEKTPVVEKAVEQAKSVVTDLKTEATKALSEIKEQAQTMKLEDLKAMALKYKDAIMSQEGEVNTLMEKIKATPLAEQLGDEAKKVKAEITKVTEAIKPLKERYDVYIGKLKELKANISSLELK